MKLLRRIFYFFFTQNELYKKQPYDSLICFPVAIYNAYVYKGLIPPPIKTLMKKCNCKDTGTKHEDAPIDLMVNKLGMVPTKHCKTILKKGGIMLIDVGNSNPNNVHAILCYPTNKKKVYACINFGSDYDKIIELTYRQFLNHFPKYDKSLGYKGYYFDGK